MAIALQNEVSTRQQPDPQHRKGLVSWRSITIGLSLVLGLAAAVVPGCTPTSLVEQGIERELPKYVGPADRYDVQIQGLKVNEGSAQSVAAVGERVRPEGAPTIERLALNLTGVVYDREAEKLSQVESAELTAVIRTPDLVEFLETYRNVNEASIVLRSPDEATLRVRPQFGNYVLPDGVTVDVTGQLVGAGAQLRFEVSDVSAGGLDVSAFVARRLSNMINPLADLRNLPVSVEVQSVIVAGETIGLEVVGDPSSFSM